MTPNLANNGWIKIWRALGTHHLWFQAPATYLKVWVGLLLRANYEEGKKYFDYAERREMPLPPGGVLLGGGEFAAYCSVTRATVLRACEYLVQSGMITKKANSRGTVVTITNWADYQGADSAAGQRADNGQTTTGQRPDTTKKLRNKEIKNIYTPEFEEFWALYPLPVAKVKAAAAFPVGQAAAVIAGLRAQLPELKSREIKYVPHPATWLNQQRWTDRPTGATPPHSSRPAQQFILSKDGF